jgi:hypothetical protein
MKNLTKTVAMVILNIVVFRLLVGLLILTITGEIPTNMSEYLGNAIAIYVIANVFSMIAMFCYLQDEETKFYN